ncbi:hypothetical protein MnTg02_03171 [bacterium MnTg02]|nr:hypothetical protein MnTg02_03171 [bacterium MnTg02]
MQFGELQIGDAYFVESRRSLKPKIGIPIRFNRVLLVILTHNPARCSRDYRARDVPLGPTASVLVHSKFELTQFQQEWKLGFRPNLCQFHFRECIFRFPSNEMHSSRLTCRDKDEQGLNRTSGAHPRHALFATHAACLRCARDGCGADNRPFPRRAWSTGRPVPLSFVLRVRPSQSGRRRSLRH